MKKTEVIEKIYAILEPEITAIVAGIENKPATTQNRYGSYMIALSSFKKATGGQIGFAVIGDLLVKGGGNQQGIASALQVMGVS